jgi:hypothetical protein
MASLVKDMSQWSNKFSVLEDPQDIISSQPETLHTKSEFMSATPSPEEAPPPERIYIRSLNPKTSTQLPIVLRSLDTGVRMSVWLT